MLAVEFVKAGHSVHIVTTTPDGPDELDQCYIHRNPRAVTLVKLHRWADVVFHNNITLTWAWPLLIFRRPLVSAVHISVEAGYNDKFGVFKKIKLLILKRIAVIAPSHYLAMTQPFSATVIPNAFDATSFHFESSPLAIRNPDRIAFVGRLIPEKGLDVLLEAMTKCKVAGKEFSLEVIGDGPALESSRSLADRLGLGDKVTFHGSLSAPQVATILQTSHYMVVPSTGTESFGVVALEGIASGCQVLCSDIGGLPEAVGSAGWLFPPGSAEALQDLLLGLAEESITPRSPEHLEAHTRQFEPSQMAASYLDVLINATGKNPRINGV